LRKEEKINSKSFLYISSLYFVLGKPPSPGPKYTRRLGARIQRNKRTWEKKRRKDMVPGKKSARKKSSEPA
jgi:hypothetical protein